ncbi:MAG: hypothetical protein LJE96_07205 [Deltaproteobacteria bacterium]|nr:hypothetical protein [Deltaproteobacteria bacterium]
MKIGTVVLMVLFLAACVTAKTKSWTSIPSTRQVQNADFSVQLTPLKRDKANFVSFRLFIDNKTNQPLKIDWNKTRYLCDGKSYGPVVFPSIDPATIKESIPPAVIPAGGTFTREIFPLKLVAFAPMREQILDGEGRGLYPGPLPQGENTIDLVIYQGERQIRQQITVDIQQN